MKSYYIRTGFLGSAAVAAVMVAVPVAAQNGTQQNGTQRPAAAPPTTAENNNSAAIVVTAQKREQRLQDVPIPVTALNTRTLAQTGQVRLQDYYSSVPGLNLGPSGTAGNQQSIVIRGITTGGATNSTVGVTVDDVPYGSNFSFAGNITPDFDPGNLARVEVLRGPQGTLYGAASMGGLIKFVTVDPSTARPGGYVNADINNVYHGGWGYGLRGALNLPLSGELAVRASAFTRQDAGYIDNPLQNRSDVNEGHISGGLVSALWAPSELFRLKLSGLYQNSRANSIDEVDVLPGYGYLQQNANVGCCALHRKLQAYSATINSDPGNIHLTSVTGYNVNEYNNSLDYSYILGGLAKASFGVNTVRYQMHGLTKKFTQEVRASAPIGRIFDFLVGGFYQHEKTTLDVVIPAVTASTGKPVGSLADILLPYSFSELAIFSNLTVKFSDRFNIQLGGRESFIHQVNEVSRSAGPLFGNITTVTPRIEAKPNVFTFSFTPQFRVTPDVMIYGRIASGYRQGEINTPVPGFTIPPASKPDRTINYEVGAKGNLFDRHLSFDVSIYYIDWKDIQLRVRTSPVIAYTSNGSGAKSVGFEAAVEARPVSDLTLRAWYAYDDAEITKPMPAGATIYAPVGTRLPYSARQSANFSVNEDFPVGPAVKGFIGGEVSYVGKRFGIFQATPARQVYPAYTKIDLRAGAKYRDWLATFYVNNVADRRGVIGGGLGNFPPYGFYYIRPRTIGLSLARNF
jgi:outer membrane receptor protein involved in Fe transport